MAWSENVGMRVIEERFTHDIRRMLFHSQINHTLSAFHSKQTGKYVLRYSSDMMGIQYYLSKGIIKSISDFAFLLVAFALLFQINQTLTLALMMIFLSGAIIMLLLAKFQEQPNEKRRSARSSLISFIEQRLHAFATIKVFNRAHPEEMKFDKRNDKFYRSAIDFHLISAINKSLPQVIFFAAIGILLFLALPNGEYQAIDGSLLVFILMLLYLQSVYKRLLRVPSILNAGSTAFTNLLSLLNLEHENMHSHIQVSELKGNIEIKFEDVCFQFDENKNLIEHLSADFKKGLIHRIAGPSGSGKSTILKLMMKLYTPTKGVIRLGSHSLKDIGGHDLRKLISGVSDEFPLLGKTIFETISYSRKEAKKEVAAELVERLGLCPSGQGITYLERKIKTYGSDLSSGERRMLQFARALLTRKPILLLDEPFLGLNELSEAILCAEIHNMKSTHLIILVANNLPEQIDIDQTITL
jgi:ABC-type multidrug transport system fused ATPase/permease subunit